MIKCSFFGFQFELSESNILASLLMLLSILFSLAILGSHLVFSFYILPFLVLPEVFPEYFVEGFFGTLSSVFLGFLLYGLTNKLIDFKIKFEKN